ncbi:S8/S53 family peptidase [Gracilimonas sp.]|uniref:S8/S53 family peptidase n=1 Tax=Gracilimonas sp. TaxID=1974203 RepID=UPI0025C42386|nr:S8/S53 family peptidase [Gracilimonas sp.]
MGQAVIGPDLQNALNKITEPVEIIVTFWGDNELNDQEKQILNNAGITSGYYFKSLPIAGVSADQTIINTLASYSEVRSIYLNKELTYYNYEARKITGVDKVQSDPTFTSRNGGMPVSGKGVSILVNDSGVDGTHPDLEYGDILVQNVLGSTNLQAYSSLGPVTYVENQPNTDTNSGHGTHVAGTVAGRGVASNSKYQGVAIGADLIGYGSGGVLFVLDGIGGFDYALTHQFEYSIRAITNSWGSSGDFDPNHPINIASKMAYDRGMVTLFAAGNSGPGENTHNPYAKAPWVISVGAGDKAGELADFSSRGTKGGGGTFEINGETYTWKDEPTIVAPGVDIISTRTISPIGVLSTDRDLENIEEAYLAYYTTLDGTSMATPHVAGIVALLLEINPSLTPDEVKSILQQTATNMYGRESWEVGAGYVNAYAAVQNAFDETTQFGSSLNAYRTFNSHAFFEKSTSPFEVTYDPTTITSTTHTFSLTGNESAVVAKVSAEGLAGETGNTINLILIAPDGTEYSSGISVLFAITFDRVVQIANPMAGEWTVEVRGLRGNEINPTDGLALPETVEGTITTKTSAGYSGLNDIEDHPAETAIKLAITDRLMDGFNDKNFSPDKNLKRIQLADYLMMGQQVRQHLPINGSRSFSDIDGEFNTLITESAVNRGAALRDTNQIYKGVMRTENNGKFEPKENVSRAELAYSLVQGLGMERLANSAITDPVTVQYKDERIPLDDSDQIPEELKGHVQMALDLGIMHAEFSLEQGPFDLEPTITAIFSPDEAVKRAEYAVAVTRTQSANPNAAPAKVANNNESGSTNAYEFSLQQNYPNPFNPSTNITYSLNEHGMVSLNIYNILGQKVASLVNTSQEAGRYTISWDAHELSSGIYIYRLETNDRVLIKKMHLIK